MGRSFALRALGLLSVSLMLSGCTTCSHSFRATPGADDQVCESSFGCRGTGLMVLARFNHQCDCPNGSPATAEAPEVENSVLDSDGAESSSPSVTPVENASNRRISGNQFQLGSDRPFIRSISKPVFSRRQSSRIRRDRSRFTLVPSQSKQLTEPQRSVPAIPVSTEGDFRLPAKVPVKLIPNVPIQNSQTERIARQEADVILKAKPVDTVRGSLGQQLEGNLLRQQELPQLEELAPPKLEELDRIQSLKHQELLEELIAPPLDQPPVDGSTGSAAAATMLQLKAYTVPTETESLPSVAKFIFTGSHARPLTDEANSANSATSTPLAVPRRVAAHETLKRRKARPVAEGSVR